jgi:hypothetical protein
VCISFGHFDFASLPFDILPSLFFIFVRTQKLVQIYTNLAVLTSIKRKWSTFFHFGILLSVVTKSTVSLSLTLLLTQD